MLTETIINVCDLAEAEGRLLRRKILHTLAIALLMMIAAFMLSVALIFVMTAIFYSLTSVLSLTSVFLIMALVALLLAGGILWIALRLNRKQ